MACTQVNYTIYAVLVGATVFIAFLRSLVFFAATVRASRVLHDRMLDAVLRAPMSFFDSNPVGRVRRGVAATAARVQFTVRPMRAGG